MARKTWADRPAEWRAAHVRRTNQWRKDHPITAEQRAKRATRQREYLATPEGRAVRDQRTAERRSRLARLKAGPCLDCGGQFPPECMDFDHRDPSQKEEPVSYLYMMSLDRLLAEIAKCDLVCANCHRIRTTRALRGS